MDAADRLRLASKLDKRETLAFAHRHTQLLQELISMG